MPFDLKFKIMKKIFIACFLILIAKVSVSQKSFRLGLNFAPSYAWLKPDVKDSNGKDLYTTKGTGTKIGFSYGLAGEFAFGDNYSFATGLLLTTNGGGLEYKDSISIDTSSALHKVSTIRKHNLQYVEIPLTLKLKTNEIGYITYYGQFGFKTAFLVRARANDVSEGETLTSNIIREDIDIRKEINFLRTSLVIGAGLEYSLGGKTSFIAGIAYDNGFSNIFAKDQESIEGIKLKAKSNYIALNVGVLF